MTVHLSFRHRRVLCKRCRRPFAAHSPVCPHCGTDRKKLHGKSSRFSLGFVIAVVLVVMLIGGYMLMRETGLDARIKAMSAHRSISHASTASSRNTV